MSLSSFALIFTSVVFATSAQFLLKVGADIIRTMLEGGVDGIPLFSQAQVYFNVYILLGLIAYVFSTAIWVFVLTKVDFSVGYPILSLGFVVTIFLGAAIFGESITVQKIIGTMIIVTGCYILARA